MEPASPAVSGTSTPDQVDTAVDLLAARTFATWSQELVRRGIQTPAPVRVRWRWAAGDIALPRQELATSTSLNTDPAPLAAAESDRSGGQQVLNSGLVTRLHQEVYGRLRHGKLVLIVPSAVCVQKASSWASRQSGRLGLVGQLRRQPQLSRKRCRAASSLLFHLLLHLRQQLVGCIGRASGSVARSRPPVGRSPPLSFQVGWVRRRPSRRPAPCFPTAGPTGAPAAVVHLHSSPRPSRCRSSSAHLGF